MDYGFVRAAAAIPNVKIADCVFNVEHTAQLIKEASSKDIQIVAFPELGITGYTCGDLFEQELLFTRYDILPLYFVCGRDAGAGR